MSSYPTSEPKKRGRPSKKDVERKQAEAIARGEIIKPGLSTPISGQPVSGEDVNVGGSYATILPTPPSLAPTHPYESSPKLPIEKDMLDTSAVDSPGKKKRPRPSSKSTKVSSFLALRETTNSLKPPSKQQPGEGTFQVHPISRLIEPAEPHASTSTEPMQAGPVAGPVEGSVADQSTLPVASEEKAAAVPEPPSEQ